ncbi:MAG: FGGY family carbohydrate kinase [Planctomycetes bacterium]|nr:FGGY family carbohydrate kinase [Planctomycetota bacterium]
MKYFLGVDVGSSAIKLTLLTERGEITATSSREYETFYPFLGWAEQDPESWVDGFINSFRDLTKNTGIDPKDIKALCPSSATHTGVLLDAECRPVRKVIFWTDQRSTKETDKLNREHGEVIFARTYHYPDTMWTLPQIQWVMNNEPDVFRKVKRILFAKDYLRYRLAPVYCTDYIDALGSMFFNAETNAWDSELCGMIGFTPDDMPKIVNPSDIIGNVCAEIAAETGLSQDTLVVAGASDTALEVFASGAVRPNQMTVKMATAGRICQISPQPYPNRFLVNYRHVVEGLWYPGTGTRSCASSYRWFKDVFGQFETEQSKASGGSGSAYDFLNQAAAEVPLGSEGLFYHPYLLGEFVPYRDPTLRASFVGATMKHGKGHFVKAVMEGVAFSLLDCLNTIRGMNLPEPSDIRGIGGGAQSPMWRGILCDILGIPIIKAEVDDSSFGAAMFAAVAMGCFKDTVEAADRCVKIRGTSQPDLENHKKYIKQFELYKKIQAALAPIYHELHALREM